MLGKAALKSKKDCGCCAAVSSGNVIPGKVNSQDVLDHAAAAKEATLLSANPSVCCSFTGNAHRAGDQSVIGDHQAERPGGVSIVPFPKCVVDATWLFRKAAHVGLVEVQG